MTTMMAFSSSISEKWLGVGFKTAGTKSTRKSYAESICAILNRRAPTAGEIMTTMAELDEAKREAKNRLEHAMEVCKVQDELSKLPEVILWNSAFARELYRILKTLLEKAEILPVEVPRQERW